MPASTSPNTCDICNAYQTKNSGNMWKHRKRCAAKSRVENDKVTTDKVTEGGRISKSGLETKSHTKPPYFRIADSEESGIPGIPMITDLPEFQLASSHSSNCSVPCFDIPSTPTRFDRIPTVVGPISASADPRSSNFKVMHISRSLLIRALELEEATWYNGYKLVHQQLESLRELQNVED